MLTSLPRRAGAVLAAVALALPATPAVAAPADKQVVIFGDSFFANPTYRQVGAIRAKTSSDVTRWGKPGRPSPQDCPQGASSVGAELETYPGVSVRDYSCSAARAAGGSHRPDFGEQLAHAKATGRLNRGTDVVFVQFGANDAASLAPGGASSEATYSAVMTKYLRSIRRTAPGARVVVVSYPSISAPNGAMCPVRTGANRGVGVNLDVLSVVRNLENFAFQEMRDAARRGGAEFYNLRAKTKYHNMCAPERERWISGVFEYAVPHNLYNHYTHRGNRGVAKLLYSDIIRHA